MVASWRRFKGGGSGEMLFGVDVANFVKKTLKPKDYEHFWQNYEKADPQAMMRIRQKAGGASSFRSSAFTVRKAISRSAS